MDPLDGSLPVHSERLQTFVSSQMGEPDELDTAELARLVSQSSSQANQAFLTSLIQPSESPASSSADVSEALALLSSSQRPRVRGLVRATAARLAAEEARTEPEQRPSVQPRAQPDSVTTQLTSAIAELRTAAAAASAAAATTVPSLPPEDAIILMIAPAGTAAAAHQIAATISGTRGLRPLPAPCNGRGGAAYPWLVRTRYFSASVWLAVAPLTASNAAALGDLAARCGAIVALFDDDDPDAAGWDRLTQYWDSDFRAVSDRADICIAMGVRGVPNDGEDAGEVERMHSKRVEWCLDHGLELIHADVSPGSSEMTEATSAARGGPAGGRRSDDPEGLPRLVEALTCRMWTPLEGVASAEGAEEAHQAAVDAYAAILGATVPRALANGNGNEGVGMTGSSRTASNGHAVAPPAAVVGATDLSDRLLLEIAGEEGTAQHEEKSAEEQEADAMEKLIEQMTFLRERGETLSPEARRERAAQAAMEMAKICGDDDDEY